MDSLPIDTSHPQVREYIDLVRLQVLTPLSVLVNIVTVLVCSVLVNPSLGAVSKRYATAISPNPPVIAGYLVVLYAALIGYCFLLVIARKPETKRTITKAIGLWLVLANWIMAGWAIVWVLGWFTVATVLQGILLGLLLYSNIALLVYHTPASSRPFDMALIHAPMRFFIVLPLSILFPLSIFITLHMTFDPQYPPEKYSAWHAWAGFAVVFSTNLFGTLIIALRRDFIWCVAATWTCVSLWAQKPKPAPVFVTAILFTALHPVVLLASVVYHRYYGARRIELTGEEDDHPALYGSRPTPYTRPGSGQNPGGYQSPAPYGHTGAAAGGPREIGQDGVWS